VIRSNLLNILASPQFTLVLVLIKISIVFGLGFLLARLLRNRSAAMRHFIWVATLLSALALPALTFIAPQLEWPVLSASPVPTPVTNITPLTPSSDVSGSPTINPYPVDAATRPSLAPFLSITRLWLLGALGVAFWCALGHLALFRLSRRARPMNDASWQTVLDDTSRAAKLSRTVRLLVSPAIDTPMTWGVRRPLVLLPESATEWSPERRRAVLLHELAHVARMDFMVQLVASITCALYWFHPAAWSAARRLRHESEHACDDRAIASGTPAPDYASHLLCLALQSKARHWHEAMAIGLTRPSTLEARVRAVLDEDKARRALSPRVRLAGSILLGAFVILLSALTPVRAALNNEVLEQRAVYDQSEPEATKEEPGTPIPANYAEAAADQKAAAEYDQAVAAGEPSPVAADNATKLVSRTLDAKSGERLDLRLEAGGDVTIEGWDEPQVQVLAHINGPDADKIKVDVDRTGTGVQVKAYFAQHLRTETSSNDFQVRVPRRFDVKLHSAGGGFRMSHVEGSFEGETGGGEIILEHVKGHARLSTGGADIRVSDSHLDGDVATGAGSVDLVRVNGGLVGSSGYGDVRSYNSRSEAELEKLNEKLRDLSEDMDEINVQTEIQAEQAKEMAGKADELAAKAAEISKSGGSIELTDIPHGATLSTGGGNVNIGRTAGPVIVSTGGGDMSIGPVYGSLSASTGGGDIVVRVATNNETIDLSSGSGKIMIELPASFDGRIDLETAYTKSHEREARIDSDWKLTRDPVTEWMHNEGTPRKYVRAHGTLGDGRGHIRVSTVNGDIVLRRSRQ